MKKLLLTFFLLALTSVGYSQVIDTVDHSIEAQQLIEKQQKEDGQAYVSTVLFDDQYEVLHDHVNLNKINRMTDREYYARGCTALLDAVGKTITSISNKFKI